MGDNLEFKRIFINHLDTYTGYNLGNFLHKCVVGASLDEEEEEEEVVGEIEGYFPKKDMDKCYEIHGSLKKKTSCKPQFAKSILKYDTREEYFEHLMEFDVIMYDISEDINQIDEALWVANKLHENFQYLSKEVVFVLLSSFMTWSKTKPIDPDDTEAIFTEEDVKRRKPHPNFKEHFNTEKEIMKLGKKHKSKIKMYVVVPGLLYGNEECILHDFFKKAWNNSDFLYCYGNGSNILPTIHINDLAGIIQNIADAKPDTKYIIAADDSKNTLEEIVKAISTNLSNGKIRKITKEQALVDDLIEHHDLEILLTDVRIDATSIKEEMKIKWVSETGFVDFIELLVKQYIESRKLTPIKACILGPPGSGKSFFSSQIADQYQLKHLQISEVITSFMTDLDVQIEYPTQLQDEIEQQKASTETPESGEEQQPEEEDRAEELEEAKEKASQAQETKERFLKNMEENDGRLYDEDVVQIYKERLMKKDCINHGFLLDGFPKTKEQANLLFAPVDEDDAEEESVKFPKFNPQITPNHVFLLVGSDQFLIDRFQLTHSDKCKDEGESLVEIKIEEFRQKLVNYRSINDDLEKIDEDSVITYFELREIYPIKLELKQDLSKDLVDESIVRLDTLNTIRYELGSPTVYPPSDEEMVLIKLREEVNMKKQALIEKENKKAKDAEMLTIRKHNQNEWNENLDLVKKEMYEYYEAQSIPLRNYLMQMVMPVLTEGLSDCSKVRSEDPIDFLSEFILKNNSAGNSADVEKILS